MTWWPIAVALLLALALHLRLLYRAPTTLRTARAAVPSMAIRVIRADVTAPALAPSVPPTPAMRVAVAIAAVPAASTAAPTVAASASASASASKVNTPATSASVLNANVAEGRFTVGRLLDLLGIPLEVGTDAPERFFIGLNTLPPAPDYLTGEQFEAGPQPQGEIAPIYPNSADGQTGVVVMRLLISEVGAVDDVGIIQSLPFGVFDEAAVSAFLSARFTPATVQGKPVKSQITIEVQFAPSERVN